MQDSECLNSEFLLAFPLNHLFNALLQVVAVALSLQLTIVKVAILRCRWQGKNNWLHRAAAAAC